MHIALFPLSLHLLISAVVVLSVKLRTNFAPSHPYHTPSEIHQSPCTISEKFRSCWVKTTKKSSWTGIKASVSSGDKFVLLKPRPQGSFNHARRVCEACDLEVSEIWDENDLEQFLVAVGENDTSSYWIGAFLNNKQTKKFRWTYQDGKTFVGFKEDSANENGTQESNITERSCLTLTKTGEFSTWTVAPCSSQNHSVLCQYKRKYDCYDGEKLSLTLMQTGHYFSSKGLPWSIASHICETQSKKGPLSLMYFHPKASPNMGSLLAEFLPLHHHNPSVTEIWTGARFEGVKLFWHLNPAEKKSEMTEWKELPWGQEPKLDEDVTKSCVYTKLDKDQELKMFAGDCEQERFFVCKTQEDNGPVIKYCENDTLIERKSSECKWNWVFDKKPDCLCFKGVHGLTSHTTCNTRLLLSPQTRCIKLPSLRKSILHWKSIPEVDPLSSEPFLLLQNRARRGHKFIQWITLKSGSKRQIFGDANVYFKGLAISISISGEGSTYCFERNPDGAQEEEGGGGEGGVDGDGAYSEIRIRNESFWIVFNDAEESCGGGKNGISIKSHTFSGVTDECELKCSEKSEPPPISATPTQDPKTVPEPTNLNSEMLKHMVDSMFGKSSNKSEKVVQTLPDPRLLLLDKLFDITRNICSCMVPTTFLDNALQLFKVAYSTGNYEYGKDFQRSEIEKIGDMLSKCQIGSEDKVVVCERNECSGRALKTTQLNSQDASLKTTPLDDTGYLENPHHHLIEVVWHAVEIWNVGCIREFKESYLLYHALEQAIEKLFVGEIRKLWHNPSIPPNYYQHLLGPNEEIHMSNLKNCVNAVYESNPKVLRLVRPKSFPPNHLGKQIRNRKNNEEFLHEHLSKTIFCSKDQFCLD